MSERPPIADSDAAMLARLAELDLAAAERAHARMMAADEAAFDPAARTYQRLARSLRQTLFLKARLEREPARKAPEAPPARPGGVAVARRMRELRAGVSRVIWAESPDTETADWNTQELEERITTEMLRDDFTAEDLDDHVARVCLALGFEAETVLRWRELPDPPPRPPSTEGEDDPPDSGPAPRESSA